LVGLMRYFSSCMSGNFFPRTPWKKCGKSAHVRPQGFERPCRKATFTRPIFCRSLSGTASPLRYRKNLIDPL
jgi:hypothetical protein